MAKVAYLVRASGGGWKLKLCESGPCNGSEYYNAPSIGVSGKREARAYCAANGYRPWNF